MQLHTGILTRNKLACGMLVYFLEINYERPLVCKFGITEIPIIILILLMNM